MSRLRIGRWSTAALEIAALMLMLTAFPAAAKGGQDKSATASAKDSQYVGADTCKGCHEDIFKNFEKTPHWKTTLNKTHPEWQGCEGCHGPGAEHVAGGGDKSKIFTFKDVPVEQVSKRCMSCHEYGEEHANFDRSQHNINSVSCIACHSPHHAQEPQFLLIRKQPDLCFGCHTDVKPDFSKPFRHRVEQGLIRCTDCHNQHGGFLTKQLRATAAQDQVCFKCHTDKAGPFTFEHQPVKTEGCVACHTPHGSTNPRLLKRSQINLLCLECHTFTVDSAAPAAPSFHNQAQKYQACTMCHVQIHGSNFDSFFFK